jgi:DNA-binding response OmpR family regulator
MGDQQIAMRAGASEYLRKPFDPDQLVAVVDCLLDERSRRLLSAGPPGLIA